MNTWMNGRFAPTDWNYYESLDHTTTNAAESTNWRVFLKTGTRNPNVYTSVGVIKEDLKETEKLLDLLEAGKLRPHSQGTVQPHHPWLPLSNTGF